MEAKRREIRFYRLPDGRVPFHSWTGSLRDVRTRVLVEARLYRAARGNFGDHKSVGAGVYEMRLDHGPGYRVYYGLDGTILVVILTGGAKSRQAQDILEAKEFWKAYLAARDR